MRFGVCMPIEQAEFIAKLGFDYLEVSAAGLAEMTEAQFADFLQKNEAAPIHAEAANCMFPGSIKLTGDNVDFEAIQTYVNHAIGRLAQAGIKIGVFGSGGSRRARKGYERGAAALHFSGKHCRRGTQGQKVHKEVIKQKKLNVHVFCAAAPTEVQGLPPSLLAADGNGCARSVSA